MPTLLTICTQGVVEKLACESGRGPLDDNWFKFNRLAKYFKAEWLETVQPRLHASTLRILKRGDRLIVDKLFYFATAYANTEPIGEGFEDELRLRLNQRYEAVGKRLKHLLIHKIDDLVFLRYGDFER